VRSCHAFWLCVVLLCLQVQTPLERAEKLSDALGNSLLLKREDLQPVSGGGGVQVACLTINFRLW
jgi:hypothetical protein